MSTDPLISKKRPHDEDRQDASRELTSSDTRSLPITSGVTFRVSIEDVFGFVVGWLDAKSCARASFVSQFLRSCADDPSLWKTHVLRRLVDGMLPVESRTGFQIRYGRGSGGAAVRSLFL
jgi:hypothetical protein